MSQPVKTLYCIGDNVCTDIFGANLYHNYLVKRQANTEMLSQAEVNDNSSRRIDKLIVTSELAGAESCHSVLVETGKVTFKHQIMTNKQKLDNCPCI